MGFLYRSPAPFQGAFAASLPTALLPMPVAGALRRWEASQVRADLGAPVLSWEDSAGSGTALGTPSGTPTLQTLDGRRAVRFQSALLQQNLSLAQPQTIAVAFKLQTIVAATSAVFGAFVTSGADGGTFTMNSLGDMYVNAGVNWKAKSAATAGWHRAIVTFDGTASSLTLNGVKTTGSAGTLSRVVFSLGGQRGANFSDLAVTHASIFPRALSAQETTTLDAWLAGLTA